MGDGHVLTTTLKPSYYNHYTVTGDAARAVVFNKFWGSVALLDEGIIAQMRNGDLAGIPAETVDELERSGFLVDADIDEIAEAHERYLERKASNTVLNITMELTQECNLACTYCYQNSYRDTGAISEAGIEHVLTYVEGVISTGKRPITDIAFRMIGGEPLLQKDKVLSAVERMRALADRLGVRLNAQIDTNGLLLDARVIAVMQSISVSLTNRADHDKVRVRHNGAGSYDQILGRLKRHVEDFNRHGTILSTRFNANALNAKYLGDVYRMIKGLGIEHTEFELYNTVNYSYNLLVPGLTREQFKRLYMELLVLKADHGEVITDFPRPTFSPCAAYTPYNLKFTAAGQLAVCDAMHAPRGDVNEVVADVAAQQEMFADVAAHDPFTDSQCGTCTNIGICGGKLFCKTNPNVADNDPCDFLPFDMDEFLQFFADYYPKMPDKFDLTGGNA